MANASGFDDTVAPAPTGTEDTVAPGASSGTENTLAAGSVASASSKPSVREGRGRVSAPELDATLVPTDRNVSDYSELVEVDDQHYAERVVMSQGGMGRIIAARDRRLRRRVALKELRAQSSELRARFEREVLLTARLQHPSIVSIHEAGRWRSGEPFYAMNLVPGRPLDDIMREARTLEQRMALLPHVLAIADALAYAHKEQVIHRDLKPQNVLVGEFGETVVIDWGLAKDLTDARPHGVDKGPYRESDDPNATRVGDVLGTPAYMAPEQARGEPADARSDVYAIGAILYHALVGEPPYTGRSSVEVLEAVKREDPKPVGERQAGVPPDLLAIIDRAMMRDPAARYPTARELADDLRRFQAGQLVGAHRYSTRELVRRWLRRHRTAVTVAVAALLVLVVVSVVGIRQIVHERQHAEDERQRAEDERALALASKGEAEGLMDFMLFDLSDKLRPIGRIKVLEAVAKKARDYYQARPELGSVADQRRRAASLLNLGTVLQDEGDSAGARAELAASLAITDQLLAADPQNVDLLRAKAAAHEALGESIRTGGDAKAALASFRTAHEIRQRLAAGAPENTQLQIDLANSHGKLARMMRALGDEGTIAEYRASLAIRERLVASAPADAELRRGLAISHDQMGDELRTRGETAAALVEFREALKLREALAPQDPNDVGLQIDIAMSHEKIGDVLSAQADISGALEHYRSSRAIRQRIAAQDPDNASLQSELGIIDELIGGVLRSQHDLPGALAEMQASVAIHKQLVIKDPVSTRWAYELQASDINMGDVLASQGKPTEALAAFRDAERICARLVAGDPDNAEWQDALTVAQERLGDNLLAMSDPAGALAEYRTMLATREKLTAKVPTNTAWQRSLSVTHYKIAQALKAMNDLPAALIEYTAAWEIMDRLAAQDRNNKQWQDEAAELHDIVATCCTRKTAPTMPHK